MTKRIAPINEDMLRIKDVQNRKQEKTKTDFERRESALQDRLSELQATLDNCQKDLDNNKTQKEQVQAENQVLKREIDENLD